MFSYGVVIVSLLGLTAVCNAGWWPFSEEEEDDVQAATSRGTSHRPMNKCEVFFGNLIFNTQLLN